MSYGATRALAGALLRANLRRLRRGAPPARSSLASPTSFVVYTFVTDDEQYRELRESFAAAGFEPPRARFVELRDRRHPDGTDPFELIARLGREDGDAYPILVHQDVRLDQGAGRAELEAVLSALTALDPAWTVAGNAGTTDELRLVRRLRDAYGGSSDDALPARVVALDENVLVFNPAARARSTPGLAGFHFYGTDVCLNAISDGGSCYVVDFPVTHLGRGRLDNEYEDAKRRIVEAWQGRFPLAFLLTPTGPVLLTRSHLLRRLLGSRRLADRVTRASG